MTTLSDSQCNSVLQPLCTIGCYKTLGKYSIQRFYFMGYRTY